MLQSIFETSWQIKKNFHFKQEILSFFYQTKQNVSVRSKSVLSFNFAKLSFFERKNSDILTESMSDHPIRVLKRKKKILRSIVSTSKYVWYSEKKDVVHIIH